MRIGLFISELIDENGYVVFPGLGAFTAREKAAFINEKEGKIFPPSQEIIFNPEIKINDGVLAGYYTQIQKTTVAKAQREIEIIADEINYKLDHGEVVELEGSGNLKRQRGVTTFEAFALMDQHPQTFGLGPVKLSAYETSKKTAQIPVKKESETQVKTKAKRKNYVYWLWLLPLLLAGVVATWWFLKSDMKPAKTKTLPKSAYKIELMKPVPSDMASIQDSSAIQNIKAVLNNLNHPQQGVYYLVGGSFRTRENAEKYFEKVSKVGWEPVHLGEIGKYHLVALAVYPTQREAVNAQYRVLRIDSTAGAWVYSVPAEK